MRALLETDVVTQDGVLFLEVRDFVLVGSRAVLELAQLGLRLPILISFGVI